MRPVGIEKRSGRNVGAANPVRSLNAVNLPFESQAHAKHLLYGFDSETLQVISYMYVDACFVTRVEIMILALPVFKLTEATLQASKYCSNLFLERDFVDVPSIGGRSMQASLRMKYFCS